MAFTAAQKQQIRNYLGAPAVYPDFQHRIEGAMDVVGEDAEASTIVTGWLVRLTEIDTALTGSGSSGSTSTYGALKKVDEVEFYPVTDESGSSGASSIALVEQGRVLIQRLARILGVWDFLPIGDYFGTKINGSFQIALG